MVDRRLIRVCNLDVSTKSSSQATKYSSQVTKERFMSEIDITVVEQDHPNDHAVDQIAQQYWNYDT